MRRSEEHLFLAGVNPRTGRFAKAGRDTVSFSTWHIHQVDLKERIVRLSFALKDQP